MGCQGRSKRGFSEAVQALDDLPLALLQVANQSGVGSGYCSNSNAPTSHIELRGSPRWSWFVVNGLYPLRFAAGG
jgi:hypothetical protein